MRTTRLLASVLLLAPLAAALVPIAEAHNCNGEDPKEACGNCREGTHNHTYNDNRPYCASTGAEDDVCTLLTSLGIDGRCEPSDSTPLP